jgi:dTDP-D-glucose 4,6-dehydratase
VKKKILVCGAAGFLMSNFVRYIMYRTKEYLFASIDILPKVHDYSMVYLNRRHNFYVGNVCDKEFLQKIVYIEKPDIIINGISPSAPEQVVSAASSVISNEAETIIQLAPSECLYDVSLDMAAAWKAAGDIIIAHKGVVLGLPYCFGMRDRFSEFARVLKQLIKDNNPHILNTLNSSKKYHWAYAEDVASMIWYIIENSPSKNKHYTPTSGGHYCIMPTLSCASIKDMASITKNIIEDTSKYKYTTINDEPIVPFTISPYNSWITDSKSIEESVRKTVQWYMMNNWALDKIE